MNHMKVTTKTIKTLHLQREQVDRNIQSNVEDIIKDASTGTMEDFNNELSFLVRVVELAAKGEYAKACQEGFTMFLLNDEQTEFVDQFFINQRDGHANDDSQLNLEVYDEEAFIDRVVENQIQF